MIFNPDLTKQAPKVMFSWKTKTLLHLNLSFITFLKEQYV